jgi:hypothetical protein
MLRCLCAAQLFHYRLPGDSVANISLEGDADVYSGYDSITVSSQTAVFRLAFKA